MFKEGSIVFPKSGQSVNTNNIAKLPLDCNIVNHLASIYIENEDLRDYVFYILKHYGTSNLKLTDTGYPTIKLSTIRKFTIPVPKDVTLLKRILQELNEIDRFQLSTNIVYEKEKEILVKYHLIY